jgi:hypothetical protein
MNILRKPASELKISDIGRTVASVIYPNKNKTAKPSRNETTYVIDTIYAHENGNIILNQSKYLRSDTVLTFLD